MSAPSTSGLSVELVNLKDSLHSSVLATMDLSVAPSQPLCQTTFCDFSAVSVRYIRELLVKSNTKSCILDPAPTSVLLKHSIEALVPAITSLVLLCYLVYFHHPLKKV